MRREGEGEGEGEADLPVQFWSDGGSDELKLGGTGSKGNTYRIDDDTTNAYEVWGKMGSTQQYLSEAQLEELMIAMGGWLCCRLKIEYKPNFYII